MTMTLFQTKSILFIFSQSKAEDGYDKKELEEETEQSTTTTCIRHRSFKKPKPYFYIGGCNGAHLLVA